MFKLGKKLRGLYNGFLDEYYYKEHFKAFSTNTERTMMSAQLFLAGLFPPKGFQQWSDKLMWQPIPVYHNKWDHTEDAEKICQRLKEDVLSSIAKHELEQGPNNTLFLESIKSYTGLDIKSNETRDIIYMLGDCIITAYDEGLPLPACTQEIYPQILLQRVKIESYYNSLNIMKFIEGPLFQTITELVYEKLNGKTKDMQMYYFSGHDKTIFILQMILGIPVTTVINTGSSLIFEVHENFEDRTHFIKVLFIDGNTLNFELSTLRIPGCQHPCDFNLLKSLTEVFGDFTDYVKDCQIS